MPRKRELIETVQDYPPLRKKHWYPIRVLNVKAAGKPRALEVTLEHLDPQNIGRRHVARLPLPILPAGVSAEFAQACGLTVTLHESVNLSLCIGRSIRAQFAPTEDGAWRIEAFASLQ